MSKIPSFQFYPSDWRSDPGVQSLSFHDRGVWFEILCLMHESQQRGKLILNDKPMSEEALSRLLGLDKQQLTKTLATLVEYGVASVCPDTGALMSRRMVRDEALRSVRSQCGKLGGNPNLLNQKSKQKTTTQDNQKETTQDNQIPTPSSSSSSSKQEVIHVGEADMKKRPRKTYPADEEFIAGLRENPAYQHINFDVEFGRMRAWLQTPKGRGRQLTRQFVLNWLNRVPRPVAIIETAKSGSEDDEIERLYGKGYEERERKACEYAKEQHRREQAEKAARAAKASACGGLG